MIKFDADVDAKIGQAFEAYTNTQRNVTTQTTPTSAEGSDKVISPPSQKNVTSQTGTTSAGSDQEVPPPSSQKAKTQAEISAEKLAKAKTEEEKRIAAIKAGNVPSDASMIEVYKLLDDKQKNVLTPFVTSKDGKIEFDKSLFISPLDRAESTGFGYDVGKFVYDTKSQVVNKKAFNDAINKLKQTKEYRSTRVQYYFNADKLELLLDSNSNVPYDQLVEIGNDLKTLPANSKTITYLGKTLAAFSGGSYLTGMPFDWMNQAYVPRDYIERIKFFIKDGFTDEQLKEINKTLPANNLFSLMVKYHLMGKDKFGMWLSENKNGADYYDALSDEEIDLAGIKL